MPGGSSPSGSARRSCKRRTRAGSVGGSGNRSGCGPRRASRRAGSDPGSGRAGRGAGRPRAAPSCTDAAGCGRRRAAGPSSTIRPRYMTAIRSAKRAAVERSCVIIRIARPLALQRVEQRQHAGADGDVEHRDRLVRDEEVGLEHQRGRDCDALALSARQLVRIAVEIELRRRQLDALERVADACLAARLASPRCGGSAAAPRRLPHAAAAGRATRTGPGRRSGSAAAAAAARARRGASMSRPSKRIAPGDRIDQPQDSLRGRGLAAAGLADERHHLAGRDRERDAVDRVHGLVRPARDACRRSRAAPGSGRRGPRPRAVSAVTRPALRR